MPIDPALFDMSAFRDRFKQYLTMLDGVMNDEKALIPTLPPPEELLGEENIAFVLSADFDSRYELLPDQWLLLATMLPITFLGKPQLRKLLTQNVGEWETFYPAVEAAEDELASAMGMGPVRRFVLYWETLLDDLETHGKLAHKLPGYGKPADIEFAKQKFSYLRHVDAVCKAFFNIFNDEEDPWSECMGSYTDQKIFSNQQNMQARAAKLAALLKNYFLDTTMPIAVPPDQFYVTLLNFLNEPTLLHGVTDDIETAKRRYSVDIIVQEGPDETIFNKTISEWVEQHDITTRSLFYQSKLAWHFLGLSDKDIKINSRVDQLPQPYSSQLLKILELPTAVGETRNEQLLEILTQFLQRTRQYKIAPEQLERFEQRFSQHGNSLLQIMRDLDVNQEQAEARDDVASMLTAHENIIDTVFWFIQSLETCENHQAAFCDALESLCLHPRLILILQKFPSNYESNTLFDVLLNCLDGVEINQEKQLVQHVFNKIRDKVSKDALYAECVFNAVLQGLTQPVQQSTTDAQVAYARDVMLAEQIAKHDTLINGLFTRRYQSTFYALTETHDSRLAALCRSIFIRELLIPLAAEKYKLTVQPASEKSTTQEEITAWAIEKHLDQEFLLYEVNSIWYIYGENSEGKIVQVQFEETDPRVRGLLSQLKSQSVTLNSEEKENLLRAVASTLGHPVVEDPVKWVRPVFNMDADGWSPAHWLRADELRILLMRYAHNRGGILELICENHHALMTLFEGSSASQLAFLSIYQPPILIENILQTVLGNESTAFDNSNDRKTAIQEFTARCLGEIKDPIATDLTLSNEQKAKLLRTLALGIKYIFEDEKNARSSSKRSIFGGSANAQHKKELRGRTANIRTEAGSLITTPPRKPDPSAPVAILSSVIVNDGDEDIEEDLFAGVVVALEHKKITKNFLDSSPVQISRQSPENKRTPSQQRCLEWATEQRLAALATADSANEEADNRAINLPRSEQEEDESDGILSSFKRHSPTLWPSPENGQGSAPENDRQLFAL